MINNIGFGGGCHWCTEAVFASLKGVTKVEQGYISSVSPNETFSEAVVVHYDPKVISLLHLIEIHLHTHSSTSMHSLRKKYRSAVYTFNDEDNVKVTKILSELQQDFETTLITLSLPFIEFKNSDPHYKEYYLKNGNNSFCQRYINPKLNFLKRHYSNYFEEE